MSAFVFSEAVNDSHLDLVLPRLSEGSEALNLESTLQDLPLYEFQAELSCLGIKVAQVFERYPLLPGVILVEQGQFVSMISRQQLLEYLLRPQGIELFLKRPPLNQPTPTVRQRWQLPTRQVTALP